MGTIFLIYLLLELFIPLFSQSFESHSNHFLSFKFTNLKNLSEGDLAHFEASLTPVGDQTMVVEWFYNGKILEASEYTLEKKTSRMKNFLFKVIAQEQYTRLEWSCWKSSVRKSKIQGLIHAWRRINGAGLKSALIWSVSIRARDRNHNSRRKFKALMGYVTASRLISSARFCPSAIPISRYIQKSSWIILINLFDRLNGFITVNRCVNHRASSTFPISVMWLWTSHTSKAKTAVNMYAELTTNTAKILRARQSSAQERVEFSTIHCNRTRWRG